MMRRLNLLSLGLRGERRWRLSDGSEVPRLPFRVQLLAEEIPEGLHDEKQLITPELRCHYWAGSARPTDGETGSVSFSTFHSYDGNQFLIRVQYDDERVAEYIVQTDQIVYAILEREAKVVGKGLLKFVAPSREGLARYAERIDALEARHFESARE